MGEVRTHVKLINAADEALARRGQLPSEQVRVYETEAMIDTGAVSTVLPDDVVHALGLDATHRRVVEYADGRQEAVDVVGPMAVVIRGRRTFEEALVLGDEVLIGQTVLEKLDLHVDCANRRVVPNPEHPDQAVNKVK
jgi:clan AA aspartic protease